MKVNLFDCRILLVDDEKDIIDINARLLKEKGFLHIDTAKA